MYYSYGIYNINRGMCAHSSLIGTIKVCALPINSCDECFPDCRLSFTSPHRQLWCAASRRCRFLHFVFRRFVTCKLLGCNLGKVIWFLKNMWLHYFFMFNHLNYIETVNQSNFIPVAPVIQVSALQMTDHHRKD